MYIYVQTVRIILTSHRKHHTGSEGAARGSLFHTCGNITLLPKNVLGSLVACSMSHKYTR